MQTQIAAVQPNDDMAKRDDDIKNKVMRVIAAEFVHPYFAWVCGIVFGLLLLSAVNTAVMDMISIQYVMSRDTELPNAFTKLNKFGVPWIALLPAVLLPVLILTVFQDLETLGDLYAIGVVGAIAINLGSCSYNRTMPLKVYERTAMAILAVIMLAIEATLVYEKPSARYFALTVVVAGLSLRYIAKAYPKMRKRQKELRLKALETTLSPGTSLAPEISQPAVGTPAEQLDMTLPKVLVATRGGLPLINFAVNYTKRLHGILMVMFVRQVNIIGFAQTPEMEVEDDADAMKTFQRAAELCSKAGVPMIPIYVVSPDVAYAILDHAATYNVESVLMGISREGAVLKALRGDVLTAVADNLPTDIPLLIHA